MGRRLWLALLLPACGFQHGRASDGGTVELFDGSGDARDDAMPDATVATPDARACFGTTDPICLDSIPTGTLVLPGVANPLDTGVDAKCTVVAGGFCVLAAQHVTVTGAFKAVGTRPLVILGSIDVSVAGTIDVSST